MVTLALTAGESVCWFMFHQLDLTPATGTRQKFKKDTSGKQANEGMKE